MIDRIGLQVTAKTAAQFYENFPQRSHKSWLIQVMQEKDYGGKCILAENSSNLVI